MPSSRFLSRANTILPPSKQTIKLVNYARLGLGIFVASAMLIRLGLQIVSIM